MITDLQMKKIKYSSILISVSLVITIVSAIHIHFNGTGEESVRLIIRWTAKFSTILFAIAFGMSAVQYFLRKRIPEEVLKYRPHIGLAFVVFHTFHLGSLIWLQYAIHPVFTLGQRAVL